MLWTQCVLRRDFVGRIASFFILFNKKETTNGKATERKNGILFVIGVTELDSISVPMRKWHVITFNWITSVRRKIKNTRSDTYFIIKHAGAAGKWCAYVGERVCFILKLYKETDGKEKKSASMQKEKSDVEVTVTRASECWRRPINTQMDQRKSLRQPFEEKKRLCVSCVE